LKIVGIFLAVFNNRIDPIREIVVDKISYFFGGGLLRQTRHLAFIVSYDFSVAKQNDQRKIVG
jgi:hypothetical protein